MLEAALVDNPAVLDVPPETANVVTPDSIEVPLKFDIVVASKLLVDVVNDPGVFGAAILVNNPAVLEDPLEDWAPVVKAVFEDPEMLEPAVFVDPGLD